MIVRNPILPLDMGGNVTIRVSTPDGKLKQEIVKHNKSTRNMTEGIAKFLRGEFNTTSLSINNIGSHADIAYSYIPAYIGLGNAGVGYNGTTVDYTSPIIVNKPNFSDITLNREVFKDNIIGGVQQNSRLCLQRSVFDSVSHTSTTSITISTVLTFSKDTFAFYYSDGEEIPHYTVDDKKTYKLTELGLFSCNYGEANDKLLAHLILDTNTPLVVDNSSVIIINWTLGVISLNSAEHASTESNYGYYEDNNRDIIPHIIGT